MEPISETISIFESRLISLFLVVEGWFFASQNQTLRDAKNEVATTDGPRDQTRPEAVNISNVANLVDAEGKPNFKYVVEGANLFFTQQARFWLEKKGVVLFKDSSTNKVCSIEGFQGW